MFIRRKWAVELGLGLVLSAGLAWLFNLQPTPGQLGVIFGGTLVVVGLLALLQRVGPFAGTLDRIGLGPPRTSVERRLSFAVGLVATLSVWLLHDVGGGRPGFLFAFAWLVVTFTALAGFYRAARRRLLGAAW